MGGGSKQDGLLGVRENRWHTMMGQKKRAAVFLPPKIFSAAAKGNFAPSKIRMKNYNSLGGIEGLLQC